MVRVWLPLVVTLVVTLLAGPAAAAPPLVELLHQVDSVVAVSSSVANDTEQPIHLVDGKLETAWNSRTGQLKGAWIAFRVPALVRVRQIELTAGFSAVKGGRDLFKLNHRITRVRVTRGAAGSSPGQVVAEQALDPDNRALQTVAVDGPGGDWRVELLEVRAGENPRWRETCVSELEVWGEVPATVPRHASRPPPVRVASLETPPSWSHSRFEIQGLDGPFASPDDLTERLRTGEPRASCRLGYRTLKAPPSPLLAVQVASCSWNDEQVGRQSFHLVVRTAAGGFVGPELGRIANGETCLDGACGFGKSSGSFSVAELAVRRPRADGPALVVLRTRSRQESTEEAWRSRSAVEDKLVVLMGRPGGPAVTSVIPLRVDISFTDNRGDGEGSHPPIQHRLRYWLDPAGRLVLEEGKAPHPDNRGFVGQHPLLGP